MLGVIKYAVSRVLERGDSIRRVTRDLNELHYVKASLTTAEKWVNKYGKKGKISSEFSKEKTPTGFSGFITLDGTFKSMKTKKKTKSGIIKRGLLLAYVPIQKKSLAGAIVKVEDKEETAYLLQALKDWVTLPINYITIDFSIISIIYITSYY